VLRFARLPDRALQTVAAALDADSDLRERVRAAVEADDARSDIGPAGVLFVERPEGWEAELDLLATAAAERSSKAGEEADDRRATRRLAAVEEEARVLAVALAAARDQVADLSAALADERAARATAASEREAALSRVSQLERERDAAHRRAAAADRDLAALRRQLDEARAAHENEARLAARRHVDDIAPSLRGTLDGAVAAAQELHASLTRAADALAAVPPVVPSDPALVETPARDVPARRRAAPVPAGLMADSAETAEHLVRLPGVTLIIDGYNASLRAWDDLPLDEQRRRLVDAAGELAARTGAAITVVFDGTADTASAMPATRRHSIDVRFTPSHIEADDAILDLVDALPAARPVLVASDDRRVRAGSERRGANVLTQRQLFGLLRRDLT
jgi:predicted RNA-binding protein with PIN domain